VKISVPFDQRVFRNFGLFIVSALIENEGRSLYMPMMIDSAASYLTVHPDLFAQLGITAIRNTPIFLVSMDYEKGKLELTTK
jgi:predicted aspartyl protease